MKHSEPPGIIDASYCEPVEYALKKYISDISDEDKRSIWLETEIGQMDQAEVDDIYIPPIEMDLQELLFEEVMNKAFLKQKKVKKAIKSFDQTFLKIWPPAMVTA